jgi:hypothetical protein
VIPQNGSASPGRTAVGDPEDAVVARLEGLAVALDVEPDAAFRAATRARLVAMAAVRQPIPAQRSRLAALRSSHTTIAAPARWRRRLTAGLAGATLSMTAVAAMAAVASNAGPGDALYGLKRGTEATQLALASDSTRGQTLLEFASTRLDELQTLSAGSSPDLVLQTLHTMDSQTTAGAAWLDGRSVSTSSAVPLDTLTTWAARQSTSLRALAPQLPATASSAATASLHLLSGVTTRAADLRTALTCPTGPSVTGTDALGPVPIPCRTGVAPPSSSSAKGSAAVPSSGIGTTRTSTATGSGTQPTVGAGTTAVPGTSGTGGSQPGSGTLPTTLPPPNVSTLPPVSSLVPSISVAKPTGQPKVSLPASPGAPPSGICTGVINIGGC